MNSAELHQKFLNTGQHQHAEEWHMAREQEEKDQSPNNDGVMLVAGTYIVLLGACVAIGGYQWLKEVMNKKHGGGFLGR
jgi:hypothetical protein